MLSLIPFISAEEDWEFDVPVVGGVGLGLSARKIAAVSAAQAVNTPANPSSIDAPQMSLYARIKTRTVRPNQISPTPKDMGQRTQASLCLQRW